MPRLSPLSRGLAVLLTTCVVALASPARAFAQPSDYRLGYGDTLTVTVVGQPNLSVSAQPIRPDGKISLPWIQEVRCSGKTVSEMTSALTRAYKLYLADPQIVVSIAKFRPVRVTLLGQVARPGTLSFEEEPTLIEALATAGGLTERGARNKIKWIAPGATGEVFDLDQVLSGAKPMPRLTEGSIVEVAEVWGPDLYRTLPLVATFLTAAALLLRQ